MKGVVKYKLGDGFMELRDVEDKPPEPDQVKVAKRHNSNPSSTSYSYGFRCVKPAK